MTTKGDGGPAFPTGTQVEQNHATGETVVHQYLSDGISVRDYFAAKAMEAWLPIWERAPDFDLCQRAYSTADNMLKARNA